MNSTGMANKFLKTRPKSRLRNTSAKIIAFYQRKGILLLKNKDKTYELPGGHIKIGEPTNSWC